MATGSKFGFFGTVKLPFPDKYGGTTSRWEEWGWNLKTCVGMFDEEHKSKTLIDDVEGRDRPLLDTDPTVALDTGDVEHQATLQTVNILDGCTISWPARPPLRPE